ncbi:MAG: MmcQ/YjbR family DNA-binding protein [Candidatus Saccharibacteria bacterium]|nr:MmcQ/YjbR family DNA-binding protein [Candidatus Saccharibacteria bacterium]
MTEDDVRYLIASFDGVTVDGRSDEANTIYSIDGEIVAVVKNGSNPLQLSLRCDYNLGELLCNQYESVSRSNELNKRRFISVLMTGQLADDEVRDQIRHAYEQTKELIG